MDNDSLIQVCEIINSRYTPQFIKEAYTLLSVLFNNIIKKPGEDKFRLFNLSNNNIKNKVLIIKEIYDLIEIIGYYDYQENFMRFDGSPATLKEVVNILNIYLEENEKQLIIQEKLEKEALERLKKSNNESINNTVKQKEKENIKKEKIKENNVKKDVKDDEKEEKEINQ